MLRVDEFIGRTEDSTSGMDCLEKCLSKQHFKQYNKKITYRYNASGFRDEEWPSDLSDVIWCVGDSFTVGIGQPFEETWPRILQKKTGRRCLNIGEDGCSNDTMSLRIQEISKLYNPKLVVAMWSYFHRRRVNNENVHHDENDFGYKNDLKNFIHNYNKVNNLPVTVVNLVIPGAVTLEKSIGPGKANYIMNKFAKTDLDLLWIEQLDRARDGHHFDVKTSSQVCDRILEKIATIKNLSK